MVKKRNCKKFCSPKVSEFIFKMFQNANNKKKLLKRKTKTTLATTIATPLTKITFANSHVKQTTAINKTKSLKNVEQKKLEKLFKELQHLFYSRIY